MNDNIPQTSSVTKSFLSLTLNINGKTKGLISDIVHSLELDSSRNRKLINFTMDSTLFCYALNYNDGFNVKVQTSVPINLTPVGDAIDSDVTMELEVSTKRNHRAFKGRLEKTEQLRMALRNTTEYTKCLENELENVSECDWVASKAAAMDKISGTLFNPGNGLEKEDYEKLTDFVRYKLSSYLTPSNNDVNKDQVLVEATCDLYGKTFNYKVEFDDIKIDERIAPTPEYLRGRYVPFSV